MGSNPAGRIFKPDAFTLLMITTITAIERYLFLSIELNFRRPIYPEVHLFAKLFHNIESNGLVPQGFRAAGWQGTNGECVSEKGKPGPGGYGGLASTPPS